VEYDSGERELYDASGGQCRDWSPGQPGDPCELDNLAADPEYADLSASLSSELSRMVIQPLARIP
jgi:hypothetical protein